MVKRENFDNEDDFLEFQASVDKKMRELNGSPANEAHGSEIKKHVSNTLANINAQIIIQQRLEEAKNANIEILAQNKAKETCSKQGAVLDNIITDINIYGGNPSMRRAYIASKYGTDIAPEFRSNDCLIVQLAALKSANLEFAPQISEQITNITKSLANTSIDEASIQNGLENKSINIASYLDENGCVKKDSQGKPLLKDGDFAFVQTSSNTTAPSAFHILRLNIAEDGKVTYSAGSNNYANAELGSFYKNSSCAIFHTQDYIADLTKEQYKGLDRAQVMRVTTELYPDQVITVDREAIISECYNKKIQTTMSYNQDRKEEAINKLHSAELSPTEKLRALQMGKTINQANQQPENITFRQPQGFNIAAFNRIQALRAKLNS